MKPGMHLRPTWPTLHLFPPASAFSSTGFSHQHLNMLTGPPGGASCKEPACEYRMHKDLGLILGSGGRSLGVGNDNPL